MRRSDTGHHGSESGNGPRGRGRAVGAVAALIAIALIAIWLRAVRGGEASDAMVATFAARKGPLTISVPVTGTIKAREQVVICNQVQGRSSIVWIIPEGTEVTKGDRLIELDTSYLRDHRLVHETRVQNAKAACTIAEEDLAVIQNQAVSDVNQAELTLLFAHQDLEKYRDGEYPSKVNAAQNEITLAAEELARAEETLRWSNRLFEEKYISLTEKQADTLSRNRAHVKVQMAENNLRLLEEYTGRREIAKLESDVYQAKMALERARRRAKATLVRAEARVTTRRRVLEREVERLADVDDQLAKSVLVAPTDGMVIYATTVQRGGPRMFDSRQPLQEGVQVFERQELFYLPVAKSCMAEVNIDESSLDKVQLGLPVRVKVAAIGGKELMGTLALISPLPDPQSMWMNPDLKRYLSEVYLEETDPTLRTGMNCKVEIVVAQYDEAIYVPIHTVVQVKGRPTVYVLKADGTQEERPVEIGLDNNRMVRVISGLEEGESVVLAPPVKTIAEDAVSQPGDANSPTDRMMQRIIEKLHAAERRSQTNV
jgi:HlyD family secretion protein